jgi:hypothetical protein
VDAEAQVRIATVATSAGRDGVRRQINIWLPLGSTCETDTLRTWQPVRRSREAIRKPVAPSAGATQR